jgi:tRNA A37 threonylcarbamoyladenosine dehydratase
VGHFKVDAMRERALSINPEADVVALKMFYGADTAGELDLSEYDYLLDAIDTVSSKIYLAVNATRLGVPILSCMGAGNKLDPSRFEVADLFATSVCPLARVMRTELRKRGIARYKVVYSKEPPIAPKGDGAQGCREGCVCPPGAVRNCAVRRQVPGSISFVPAAAGLVMAGEAIRTLSGVTDNREGKQ